MNPEIPLKYSQTPVTARLPGLPIWPWRSANGVFRILGGDARAPDLATNRSLFLALRSPTAGRTFTSLSNQLLG
ncbi:MAG: hypothetical protein F2723_01025 [Actinobacteria bacterium]|nr:hypothetical protein [Actinomycetota bacterium]